MANNTIKDDIKATSPQLRRKESFSSRSVGSAIVQSKQSLVNVKPVRLAMAAIGQLAHEGFSFLFFYSYGHIFGDISVSHQDVWEFAKYIESRICKHAP
jgi:hypothetical protein